MERGRGEDGGCSRGCAMSVSLSQWLARRFAHIGSGRSRVVVGHEDLAAWLPGVV
jgi:hypothetical protein